MAVGVQSDPLSSLRWRWMGPWMYGTYYLIRRTLLSVSKSVLNISSSYWECLPLKCLIIICLYCYICVYCLCFFFFTGLWRSFEQHPCSKWRQLGVLWISAGNRQSAQDVAKPVQTEEQWEGLGLRGGTLIHLPSHVQTHSLFNIHTDMKLE